MTSYGALESRRFGDDPDMPATDSASGVAISASLPRVSSFLTTDYVDPNRQRRPYVPYSLSSRNASYSSLTSAQGDSSSVVDTHRDHSMAIRYRLFSRLDPTGSTLAMPNHIVPSEFFSILPFDDFKDESGKQGSIVTIFSIWNTMMGTSLLAMPWALQQAGLAWGLFLMLTMAFLALYTAYRVVQSPEGLTVNGSAIAEFSDVCRYYWGKWGEMIAVVFSIVVLLGGIIVYWVLMSNFLYFTGNVIYEAIQPNSTTLPVMANKTFTCDVYCLDSENLQTTLLNDVAEESTFDRLWKLQGTVPIYLAVLTFPLMNFKSPSFFAKFNMLGTLSVIYLLCFTASKAAECGFNMNFTDPLSPHYVELFRWNFPALTGTLALSYFIHNAILTILRNQKNPENNARDLSIGYILSAICYVFIGFMFFAAFPTYRRCISDNFLNNFGSGDVMSAIARMFLLFQMITVLPLLMYFVRSQFFYTVTGDVYPGMGFVCLLNFCVMAIAVLFAMMYPHVGSILRYVGSLSGLVYIFTLPCAVYLMRLRSEGKLTKVHLGIHGFIVLLGAANMVSQFFV
uniref:Aa_trans domain-containing protein n=1 Tax=Steinernema glaseri TaxID=37863 RepID=A0A1I7ZIQ5_9BILA